jgi:Uma2 family endonuclease
MVAVTTLERARPFTVADLADMPDDGRRYEILDGVLLVSPATSYPHQDVVLRLGAWLLARVPDEMAVLVAPFDVVLTDDTVLQPDVLVADRAALEAGSRPLVPALVVEVRSPSTASIDRLLKRERYARAGVPAYWLVHPDVPAVTVLELGEHGDYGVVVDDARTGPVVLDRPFPLELDPALLRGTTAEGRR